MKHYVVAAGVLLLSASAIAVAADTKSDAKNAAWDSKFISAGVDEFEAGKMDGFVASDVGKSTTIASTDKFLIEDPAPKFETASFKPDFDPGLSTKLDSEPEADLAFVEEPVAEPIVTDTDTYADTQVDDGQTGMGGPVEAEVASLTPQLSSQNYPACDPGPGDDRCIQLYEPGVREQLASWTAPTGGFAGDGSETAVGGPYEPVDDKLSYDDTVEEDVILADDKGRGVELVQGL